jgi:hypothetical protein
MGYSAMFLLKKTDVSGMRTASIIALVMEAVRTSEISICSTRIHGTIFQKVVILVNYVFQPILFYKKLAKFCYHVHLSPLSINFVVFG